MWSPGTSGSRTSAPGPEGTPSRLRTPIRAASVRSRERNPPGKSSRSRNRRRTFWATPINTDKSLVCLSVLIGVYRWPIRFLARRALRPLVGRLFHGFSRLWLRTEPRALASGSAMAPNPAVMALARAGLAAGGGRHPACMVLLFKHWTSAGSPKCVPPTPRARAS
jgi:hypothetical protein